MNNALTPAVIVLRHFEDLPNPPPPWPPGPFCYKMPSPPNVQTPWRRLHPDGIKASLNYATALPGLIRKYNLCPVSRVITQDPGGTAQTQNPFDSIYPFLFDTTIQNVKLLQAGSDLLKTPHNALLPDASHSTLICWDRQTLWGKDKVFDPGLFLGQMRRGLKPSLDQEPMKAPLQGQGIYVFTNYSKDDDQFDLVIYSTFTELADTGPQPTKGPC